MSHVPLKKLKTKLIIHSACHIIKYAQSARHSTCHVSILSSQTASGSKRKNLKLQDWNLNFFFYRMINRNSPKLQG